VSFDSSSTDMREVVIESDDSTSSTAVPLGDLPRVDPIRARVEERLARAFERSGAREKIVRRLAGTGAIVELRAPDLIRRASGLKVPGAIAHFSWPRYQTKLGFGVESKVVHAVVDRLLGFTRDPGEADRQTTPVEWGVVSFLIAEALESLDQVSNSFGSLDLMFDRVGPDPFPIDGLGSIATLVWPIEIGPTRGNARLWIPESVLAVWLASEPTAAAPIDEARRNSLATLVGGWRAVVGEIPLPRGLSRLRVGGVLPLTHGSPPGQTVASPMFDVELYLLAGDARFSFPCRVVAGSAGSRVELTGGLQKSINPREAIAMPPSNSPTQAVAPTEIPVTLTVEIGKIGLPLSRVADLKQGDVLELGRHAREPVELTSGGKLVARGELVQIDTELGVRILSVFL
jgi:flagellar motor switch/type III secretory pathway protein FliN